MAHIFQKRKKKESSKDGKESPKKKYKKIKDKSGSPIKKHGRVCYIITLAKVRGVCWPNQEILGSNPTSARTCPCHDDQDT